MVFWTVRTLCMPELVAQMVDGFGELWWSEEVVAGEDEVGDFTPIYFAEIEAERDPTLVREISRRVELFGIGADQRLVIAGENFAGEADDAIAVMIIEEVGESFFADDETCVRAVKPASGFGKGESDFADANEARVFVFARLSRDMPGPTPGSFWQRLCGAGFGHLKRLHEILRCAAARRGSTDTGILRGDTIPG
jgi:hypothetical protein